MWRWVAAGAEFVASLSLSSSRARLPVIGRFRFWRRRRRTSLERFLSSSVRVIFEGLERGRAIILKLSCYKLCTIVQAVRIMPSDSVLGFI